MKTKKHCAAGAAALILTALSSNADANLILNGDFEAGSLAGWNVSGHVFLGSLSAYLANPGVVGTFPTGQFAVDFGASDTANDGIISQQFDTTTDQQYALAFDYGRFQNGPGGGQSIQVIVRNVSDNSLLLQTVVTESTGTSDLSTVFKNHGFLFQAHGFLSSISFVDVSGGTVSSDGVLDNVSISAVPEPSSIAMLGLGTLALARRRRRLMAPGI